MQLFYAPNITPPNYTLSEEESKHCVRVLRLALGDTLHITDGVGNLFCCEIVEATPKRCSVKVVSTQSEFEKLPYNLTMCVAPTKNIERFEWFLEKATEVGVGRIVPLLTKRSERKIIKFEREQKVITSAMKQSLKAYHPVLEDVTPFKEVVCNSSAAAKFIAHCAEPIGQKEYLPNILQAGGDVEILIGAEGDFTPDEVAMAVENGYVEISLGNQRLRTETAALAAVVMVSVKNGEANNGEANNG